MYTEAKTSGRAQYFQTVALAGEQPGFASQCVGCGKCEQRCPQGIPIREKLKEADRALMPFWFRPFVKLGRRFMLRRGKK